MTRTFRPKEAVQRYLRERESELSDKTIYNHRSALKQFVTFCKEEGIEEINNIDGFVVSDFKLEREEEVGENTVYNNLSSLRSFIRWCESRDIIEDNIADNMVLPQDRDDSRDESIDPEQVKEILSYLETYEYATLRHALFALLWDTGIRIGSARALNVDDFNEDEKYISIRHRPERDTPLKNKDAGERDVNLSTRSTEILADYIDTRRNQVEDDYGMEPLFASQHGRAHRTTLRKHIVGLTRPCYYSNECPHDRKIDDCEATQYSSASKCPSSTSPHPVRRSSITHWLDEGHSKELLSDRVDVSVEVLEKHYDARSEEQKRELRREMLDID